MAIVEHELEGVLAWAERTGSTVEWNPNALEIRAMIPRPRTQDRFYLVGGFQDYRELPPTWTFASSDWQATGVPSTAPSPGKTRFGSCIFIRHANRAVICAPFNRLAYAEEQGPHSNWGGPAQWQNTRAGASAMTVGEMLAVIRRDILATDGRMN